MGERAKLPGAGSQSAQGPAVEQDTSDRRSGGALHDAGMRQVEKTAVHDTAAMAQKLMAVLGGEDARPDQTADEVVTTARGGITPADPAKRSEMPKPAEVSGAREKIAAVLGFEPRPDELVAIDHYLTAHADVVTAVSEDHKSPTRAAAWEGTRALVYNALKAVIMDSPDPVRAKLSAEIDQHHLLSSVSIYATASFVNSNTSRPSAESLDAEFAGIRDGLHDVSVFKERDAERHKEGLLRSEHDFLAGEISETEQLLAQIPPSSRTEVERALDAAKTVLKTQGTDPKAIRVARESLNTTINQALAKKPG
jgi:hypothetical protein